MCGLVAIVGRAPVDPSRIAAALDRSRARGPDGRGAFADETGCVHLGHVRLRVVGGDDGAQPLVVPEGRLVAVVNGEVYEAAALRRQLEEAGRRFRTSSDSEIVPHAYAVWGDAFAERLRGELAFVVWDGARRRLLAGRDRFGVKPLVWAEHAGELLVASQPSALFAAGLPAAFDPDAVAQAVATHYVRADETLYRDVRVLPPGALLVHEAGATRVVPARPRGGVEPRAGEAPRWLDDEAAARSVREALDASVRARLVANRPPAVQLSGGIDSTLVAALARRAQGSLRAYTVAFDREGWDESTAAVRAARALDLELVVVRRTSAELAAGFAAAVRAAEGVVINAHASAKHALSRAVREGGDVSILTGEGADELFAGYPHFRTDLGIPLRGANAASRGLMLPDGGGADASVGLLGFRPTWLAAKLALGRRASRFVDLPPPSDPEARLLSSLPPGCAEGTILDRAARSWTALALEGYILRTLGDALELAHGVEGRLPFLDPSVQAVADRCPDGLKIRDGVEKWVLREAAKGLVPEEVRVREKHPFLAPPMTSDATAARQLADLVPTCHPFVRVGALRDAILAQPSRAVAEASVEEPALLLVSSLLVLGKELCVA